MKKTWGISLPNGDVVEEVRRVEKIQDFNNYLRTSIEGGELSQSKGIINQ